MTIVLIDKDVGHGSQFQQLTLVFAFSGDSQRHSRDMASKSNANLATAAAYAGPLLLMLLATMVRGAHCFGQTSIRQELPTDCRFVMFDDRFARFRTETIHPGGIAYWEYQTTFSQYYRIAMLASAKQPPKSKTIEVWSRRDWPGVTYPTTVWKVNVTGLYSMKTNQWVFAGFWDLF